MILEKEFPEGYTAKIADIENYPGHEAISGFDLTAIMQKQAESFGATVVYPVEVVDMELQGEIKRVRTRDKVYEGHAIIIAIGVSRKSLKSPAPRSSPERASPIAPPATARSSKEEGRRGRLRGRGGRRSAPPRRPGGEGDADPEQDAGHRQAVMMRLTSKPNVESILSRRSTPSSATNW